MSDDFTPPTLDEALQRLEMPLVEAMTTQRAVRRLHTDPVDPELIRRLLALALKAPTSSNSQDWSRGRAALASAPPNKGDVR